MGNLYFLDKLNQKSTNLMHSPGSQLINLSSSHVTHSCIFIQIKNNVCTNFPVNTNSCHFVKMCWAIICHIWLSNRNATFTLPLSSIYHINLLAMPCSEANKHSHVRRNDYSVIPSNATNSIRISHPQHQQSKEQQQKAQSINTSIYVY